MKQKKQTKKSPASFIIGNIPPFWNIFTLLESNVDHQDSYTLYSSR